MNATLLLIAALGVVLVALVAFFGRKNVWASKAMLGGVALTVLGFGAALLEQQYGKWVLWVLGAVGVALVALALVAWTKGRKQPLVVGLGVLAGLVGFAGLGWMPGANAAVAQIGAVTNTGIVGNVAGDAAALTPNPNAAGQSNPETAAATDAATGATSSGNSMPETQTGDATSAVPAQNATATEGSSDAATSENSASDTSTSDNATPTNGATNTQAPNTDMGDAAQTLAPQSTPQDTAPQDATPQSAITSSEVVKQNANLHEVSAACPCLINIRVNATNPRLTLTQNGTVVASSAAQVSSLRLENAGEYTLNVEATDHQAFAQTVLVNKSLNLELDLAKQQ